jgi:hypothetical protein
MRQRNEANDTSDDKDRQRNSTIADAMAVVIARRLRIIQFSHARFVHFPFGTRGHRTRRAARGPGNSRLTDRERQGRHEAEPVLCHEDRSSRSQDVTA